MRLSGNLLAGLASSAWSALIGLIVVPWYLKYLGIEAYGLIGFFATTQALFLLLDLGLAQTINREVALGSAAGDLRGARDLLHTLAVIYWFTAAIIAAVGALLAPVVAEHWLQSRQLPQQTVSHAVALMGLVVAARWPIGLYQGAVMGAQRLAVSSLVTIVMVTVGNVGAVAVLALASPTIEAFFLWQAGVGVVYALAMRAAAWRVLRAGGPSRFDVAALKRIWRFSAGAGGVAVLAVLLLQTDKLLLSRLLTLDDFGRYMLAALLASGLLVLLAPVFNTIYPRLTALVAAKDETSLADFYRRGTLLLAAALYPATVAAMVAAPDLIFLWTRKQELADGVAPILSLLLAGTALNGIMVFPYALQFAAGMTRLPLIIAGTLLALHIPATVLLVMNFGAIGGAMAWTLLNFLYLFMGTWLTHRHLLKGMGLAWLGRDVLAPLALAVIIVVAGWELLHMTGSHYLNLLLAAALATAAFTATVKWLMGQSLSMFWKSSFSSRTQVRHAE